MANEDCIDEGSSTQAESRLKKRLSEHGYDARGRH